MNIWTCPNPECPYDKPLQPKQSCPKCGKAAQQFNFQQLGKLFQRKWKLQKAIRKAEKIKQVLKRTKYCPKCGSTQVFWTSGLPQTWSLWECKKCGYRGPLILEDGDLAAKLRKDYKAC
ncbi:MAG: hypothetical protein U9O89_00310 [Thermoproteota archaeon]|nr:hypothetical protein [Thermoproteota archaeon]